MRLLAALCVLLSLGLAQFDFDPSRRWFTVSTEHFDIHYHQGLERVAPEAAVYAEQAYAMLKEEFGTAPARLSLVLSDPGDFINGFADPTSNTIGIFSAQYRTSDFFNPRLGSWWQTVIFHEVVHAIDLTQVRGAQADARRFLGQFPAQTAIRPYPLLEGMAVYMKFKKLGESRLNDSNTRMVLRQMALDGRFPSLDEVRQAYSRTAWPTLGFLFYNYGAWLVRYMEVRFGEGAVRRFADANAGMAAFKDFNWPFEQAFGVSLDAIYADFVRWLPTQFQGEIEAIRAAGPAQPTKLTGLGFFAESPSDGPAGLAYAHRSPQRAGLRLRVGDAERELIAGPVEYPQWSPDGRYLSFVSTRDTGPYSSASDLYRYDNLTGEVKRLTRDQRVYYARWAADGRSLFVARNTPDGSTELGRYWPDTERYQPLRPFPNQDGVIHSFSPSPDGGVLALSLLRRGGFQDLYRYNPDTGQLLPLTQDKNADSDPVWSPDGRYLIYSSDPGRVYNLYALRLEDGAAFQVTNLLGGAFMPAFSLSKQNLIFSGYDASGYNLYQIPYQPDTWKRVELPREPLPDFKAPEPAQGQPYNPFRYLAPLYWTPLFTATSGGLGAGAQFSGGDPVGVHSYSVAAGLDPLLGRFSYDLGYTFAGFGLPLGFRAVGLGGENAQAVGTRLWSPDGGATLQYLRDATASQPSTTHRFGVNASGLSGSGSDLFRMRGQFGLSAAAFVREGDGAWRYSGQAGLAVTLRLPAEATHLVTVRLAGGLTTSPLALDALDLGVEPVGGGAGLLSVRGYAPGQLKGQQALAGSLEYRLPPLSIERGLGNWPLFFDDLSLSVFADAGVAGSPLDFSALRYSVGAELRLGLSLFYLTSGSSVGFGVAQGIGEPGPRFYAVLVLPGLP